MNKQSRFIYTASVSAVFSAFAAAHLAHAGIMAPEKASPDACNVSYERGNPDCMPWYELDKLTDPAACHAPAPNGVLFCRWYGIEGVALQPKKIVLTGIHFDFDKYNIRNDSLPILDRNVDELTSAKSVKIKIVGHTDAKGTDEYNQTLSEKRAEAVMNFFINKGVDANRISSEGHGESEPVAPNDINGKDNPDGRAQNRRIEILIWDR